MNDNDIQLSDYKGGRKDSVLTQVSIDYQARGHICDKVSSLLKVDEFQGFLAEYGDAHLQLTDTRVWDRGKYQIIPSFDYKVSRTYRVLRHGLGDYYTEMDIGQIRPPFEVQKDIVNNLMSVVMIEKEYACAQMFITASNYNSTNTEALSGNAKFSDYTHSDPVGKVVGAMNKIFENSGVEATTLIGDYPVIQTLRAHPALGKFHGISGSRINLTDDQILAAFGLRELIVAKSKYGSPSNLNSFWGKNLIVCNRMPTAERRQTTFSYRLEKKGMERRVHRNRINNPPNTQEILEDMTYNYMISQKDAGYLFTGVIA